MRRRCCEKARRKTGAGSCRASPKARHSGRWRWVAMAKGSVRFRNAFLLVWLLQEWFAGVKSELVVVVVVNIYVWHALGVTR